MPLCNPRDPDHIQVAEKHYGLCRLKYEQNVKDFKERRNSLISRRKIIEHLRKQFDDAMVTLKGF